MLIATQRRAAAALVAAVALIPCAQGQNEALRDWQIADSIAVRYFSSLDSDLYSPQSADRSDPAAPLRGQLVSLSPNGAYFFCVTHSGDLSRDSSIFELLVFSSASVQQALKSGAKTPPRPVATARIESFSSERAALVKPRWEADSGAIVFPGFPARASSANPDIWQLQRLDVPSGKIEVLTDSPVHMGNLEYRDGGAMFSLRNPGSDPDPAGLYPMLSPDHRADGSLRLRRVVQRSSYYAQYARGEPMKLEGRFDEWLVAPGGRHAVALQNIDGSQSFALIDLKEAQVTKLFSVATRSRTSGGPAEPPQSPSMAWLDADHVILNGAAVSDPASASGPKVVNYDLAKKTWRVLESVGTENTSPSGGISVGKMRAFVRQGVNTPPALIASYGRRELELLAPDPALKGVWRAQAESFSWIEKDSESATGWLYLPRNRSPLAKLPLIIQVSAHVDPRIFAPDGPVPAGYAAQAFAARGFAVLAISGVRSGRKEEGSDIVARMQSAINALESKGLIDATRVGAIGHSRMGYQTLYAVTHPGQTPLAAAAVLDSFDGSMTSMLMQGALLESAGSVVSAFDRSYGGLYWKNKAAWLEQEPSFNADRIRTPTFFAYHGTLPSPYANNPSLESTIDEALIGAFRLNRKPMESVWLPRASHTLYRPRERQAEMQGVLDWMAFWLQGKDPQDARTAAHWAPLRQMQKESLAMHSGVPGSLRQASSRCMK